jgi:diguanylate cyclase (GGDEF)-like protein/PAS domain S-box-containing protein
MIRVLVAEDAVETRQALEGLFADEPDFELVGLTADAEEAIACCAATQPDVALVDVNMPKGGGVGATLGIRRRSPATRVVAYSAADDSDSVAGMLRAGAFGYLVKGSSAQELLDALRTCADGTGALSNSLSDHVLTELHAQVSRFAEAQRIGGIGSWEADLSTGELLWSDETSRILGRPGGGERTTFEEFWCLIHPDDRAALAEAFESFHGQQQQSFELTTRIVRADGSAVWVQARGERAGAPGRLWGTMLDITARLQSEAALSASEAKFRTLVQRSSDLALVVDAQGVIRYASPSSVRVTGWSPDELVGRSFTQFVHPDEREPIGAILAALEGPGATARLELKGPHPSGGWSWYEYMVTNLLDDPDVAGYVLNARDVSERHLADQAQRHQANHDPLTGLMNRTGLAARMAQVLSTSDPRCGFLLVDLDHFQEVNEALGHDAGDALLREVGARLAGLVGGSAVVARLRGDEFGVLVPGYSSVDVLGLADELLVTMEKPIEVGTFPLVVSASVGVVFAPDHGTDVTTLLRRADVAMYQAKAAGGAWALYDQSEDLDRPLRLALVADLRGAVVEGLLEVHYQPLVELATGRAVGTEALARWNHPERGPISPVDFIEMAEHTGLIRPLTDLVVERAFAQCAQWRSEGLDLGVSVNVSPRSLRDGDLAAKMVRALSTARLPAEVVTLEITESAFRSDGARSASTIAALVAAGFRLSIDDFGTGYSTMAQLQRLPVKEFKIDRSFVADMVEREQGTAVIDAFVSLARARGLTVVAEGIEDLGLTAVLARSGCDIGQGFGLCRPGPAASIGPWLHDNAKGQTAVLAVSAVSVM